MPYKSSKVSKRKIFEKWKKIPLGIHPIYKYAKFEHIVRPFLTSLGCPKILHKHNNIEDIIYTRYRKNGSQGPTKGDC